MSLKSTARELRVLAHDLRHRTIDSVDNAVKNLPSMAQEIEEAGPHCTFCGARIAEFGHDDNCPRPMDD